MVISFLIVQFASAAHTHEAGHEAPEEHQHCSVCLIATEPDDMPVIESNDRLDDNAEDLFEDSPLISKSCIFSETLSSNVLLYVSREYGTLQKALPYLASRAPPSSSH